MTAVMPQVHVPGDAPGWPMRLYGELMGFSRRRAVWRYGFRPESLIAMAFGISTEFPVWALAFLGGTVIETWEAPGWGALPPAKFQTIIGGTL